MKNEESAEGSSERKARRSEKVQNACFQKILAVRQKRYGPARLLPTHVLPCSHRRTPNSYK